MPERGPWDRDEPEPPPAPRGRMGVWLAMLAIIGAIVMLLFKAFPGAIQSADDWSRVAYAAGLVALVSTGLLRARRIDWGERAPHRGLDRHRRRARRRLRLPRRTRRRRSAGAKRVLLVLPGRHRAA